MTLTTLIWRLRMQSAFDSLVVKLWFDRLFVSVIIRDCVIVSSDHVARNAEVLPRLSLSAQILRLARSRTLSQAPSLADALISIHSFPQCGYSILPCTQPPSLISHAFHAPAHASTAHRCDSKPGGRGVIVACTPSALRMRTVCCSPTLNGDLRRSSLRASRQSQARGLPRTTGRGLQRPRARRPPRRLSA